MKIIVRLPKDLLELSLQYYDHIAPHAKLIKCDLIALEKANRWFDAMGPFFTDTGVCPICSFVCHYKKVNPRNGKKLDLWCRFFTNSTI